MKDLLEELLSATFDECEMNSKSLVRTFLIHSAMQIISRWFCAFNYFWMTTEW